MFTTINGYVLLAFPEWTFYALAVGGAVLAVASVVLAASRQPTPDPAEWSKNR